MNRYNLDPAHRLKAINEGYPQYHIHDFKKRELIELDEYIEPLTSEERDFIKNHYAQHSYIEIAKMLDRSYRMVKSYISSKGLVKNVKEALK